MNYSNMVITEAVWRELPPEIHTALHRALKRKSAIVDRQVLDVASALCKCGAYDLAFGLYQVRDGRPLMPYQGCGLGLMMNLKGLMGERGPDPTRILLV
jgi:hypothetical protein